MQLEDLKRVVPGFQELSHPERIKLFTWYLHTYAGRERVDIDSIRRCYEQLHYGVPNLARDMARLAERRPPELLKDATGYRLEARVREVFDGKYGYAPSSIAVANLLADLPSQVPGADQSDFLREALNCYRVKSFRSAIVMAWNLAYDHMLRWLLADATRLHTFNQRIPIRYPKKQVRIVTFDDFEDLKESEVVEIASSAGLLNSGVIKILDKELKRRNSAAHPSPTVFTQYQAEDSITDLVNNVVLRLR
ncbi:hypothetical protein W02_40400 [Nitrospira sp. KM1]|uniref:hypothetical protein n=1 Tax=Nitrospira sp. KM1 TaxID=1936990 RepID=UPI0013A7B217|nr:hypothetical protein [Nitrospira sp. KM1]BCA56900.1 hypothetical protein W02_40400 [Nitrospira sp. KM1]